MSSHLEQIAKLAHWMDVLALPAILVDSSLPDLPITHANKAWLTSHSQIALNDETTVTGIYQVSPLEVLEKIKQVQNNPQQTRDSVVKSAKKSIKKSRWYRHTFCGIESNEELINSNLVLIFEQDITWEVLENSRREQKSSIDPLTGLLNREAFLNKLSEKLPKLADSHEMICLVFIDLNKFKPINDDYGHDVGDRILIQIGERLLNEMSHGNTAGRLGGDEFVLLLTDIKDESSIPHFMDNLLDRVFKPIKISKDINLSIGGSYGYACTEDHKARVEDLLKAADQAMYLHKKNPHQAGLSVGQIVDRRKISQQTESILNALKTQELEMFLYPLVSMGKNEVIGFEVLPRWHHPTYGTLELEHFQPLLLASEDGKIFDRWLIHTAAKFSAAMQEQGYNIGIGINLTRRQLDDGSFVEFMRETASYFADGRVDLTLEIVESPYFRNNAFTFSALQQARDMGGQVVLDHFGNEKSSFSFVTQIPLDFIKLHESLTHDLKSQRDKQRYVASLIAFSHRLGHPVVASGINEEDDFTILKSLGCDLIQGGLWLKPMSLKQIEEQLLNDAADGKFKLRVRSGVH